MDVLNGLKYAHDNDIIHRDLHLGNVLKIGDVFVLSDFGWSKDLSIVRSMKTSCTQKINHIFMDPLTAGDLTKMDAKSDIYSVGKIIEYVYKGTQNNDKSLDFVINKCITRDKGNRYSNVSEIIDEIRSILNDIDEENKMKTIKNNIKHSILKSQELEYIKKLAANDELCNVIVRDRLKNFGKVVVQIPEIDRITIMQNISSNYAESTG